MAVVKFIASGCPMNNIFNYVMRDEATERKLIDGVNCMPETALEEFKSYSRSRRTTTSRRRKCTNSA